MVTNSETIRILRPAYRGSALCETQTAVSRSVLPCSRRRHQLWNSQLKRSCLVWESPVVCTRVPPRCAKQAGEPQRHSRPPRVPAPACASRGIPLHLSLGTSQPEIAARARRDAIGSTAVKKNRSFKISILISQTKSILLFVASQSESAINPNLRWKRK